MGQGNEHLAGVGRRGFVAAGSAALVLPGAARAQQEWTHPFVKQWVQGSWFAEQAPAGLKPFLIEIYAHASDHTAPGSFALRAGSGPADQVPKAVSRAVATPDGQGARVTIS